MDVEVRIEERRPVWPRSSRNGLVAGALRADHDIGVVVVIARIKIFETERDIVEQVEFAAGADLAAQLPIVVVVMVKVAPLVVMKSWSISA